MARMWCCVLLFVTIIILSYSECRRIGVSRRISFSYAKPKPVIHYNPGAVRKPSISSYPSSSSSSSSNWRRYPNYPSSYGHGGYRTYPGGNGTGGFRRFGGSFESTHASDFGNVYNSAALSLSLYNLMQDDNHYHFYFPNSNDNGNIRERGSFSTQETGNTADTINFSRNVPKHGSFQTQIGNMTCISVYNARAVNKWARDTLVQLRASFPKTSAVAGFNFTVISGEIIHNETLGVTCCGTENGTVSLAELTNGKNSDVNCVFKEFNMPFKKLKFIPINGTSINGTTMNGTTTATNAINGTATGTKAIGRTAISGG